jgi:hypothetical protein
MFTRVSLLQRSLHVTSGQNLGLKISKVATSLFEALGFGSPSLNTFQNLQLQTGEFQTSTSTLQASRVLTVTTSKYFERRIGEFPEVQGSMVHASPTTNDCDLLWNSGLREFRDFNTHCFPNRRTLEWRRVGIHGPRVPDNE